MTFKPSDDCRRALTVLAGSPDGCTEAIMLAHGFTQELLVSLAQNGLVSVRDEQLRAGKRMMAVIRLRITNTGLQALTLLKDNHRDYRTPGPGLADS